MTSEKLDIVNELDQVIGIEEREDIYKNKLSSFRTVNGFILNKTNEVWLPLRSPHKDLWPLHLDASIGGHVKSGETYIEAFVRETKEELNLTPNAEAIYFIRKLTPQEHKVTSFMHLYIIKQNNLPKFNTDDFIWGNWFSFEAFNFLLNKNIAVKPDLPILIDYLKVHLEEKTLLHKY